MIISTIFPADRSKDVFSTVLRLDLGQINNGPSVGSILETRPLHGTQIAAPTWVGRNWVEKSLLLVISDLHYEKTYHDHTWQGDALDWLIGVVRDIAPTSVIALGDLGHAWSMADWKRFTNLTIIHAIYGNHDNLETLRSAKNSDGGKVLAEDGEIRDVGGLKVGFINGIMSKKGKLRIKDGVPRQSADDFLSAASKLAGSIDVLATHASPNLPEYGKHYRPTEEFEVMDRIIRYIDPPLSLSGHLSGPFTLSKMRSTIILRIDSSPAEKHYALIDCSTRQIQVMHDKELTMTGDFTR